MFDLFIILLSFSKSSAVVRTKCLFLNDEPCIVRPTLTDMNPNELKYYPFMISLNKRTDSYNVLSPKRCVPKETKHINVKAFNMITNEDEAKAMTKHVSCDCKCKFNSTTCNSKQIWNNETCKCECKNYHKREKDYSQNPSRCICGNSKYLKSVADTSVDKCDEILIFIDNLSTKKTNTITTNVTNTASINCHVKSKRFDINNILHTVLLVIILLLIITITCYHYTQGKDII